MPKAQFLRSFWIIPIALLPVVLGCGTSEGPTVTGTASYNDQPIEKGNISFYPTEGKGQAAGGEIVNGKFTVKNVTPGKNRVEITAQPKMKGPPPTDMTEATKHPPVVDPSTLITASAVGNNEIHDITSGGAPLVFSLHPQSTGKDKKK